MTKHDQWKQNASDPLGLSDLDDIDPGYDGWAQIESALQANNTVQSNRRRYTGWLAMAASLGLVVSVVLVNTGKNTFDQPSSPGFATSTAIPASLEVKDNIDALIGLSQLMEEQVMKLRQETSSMPAESAIYVAELEDLIAQVDNELSLTPDSIDLWGQRVNLMLDLAQIYQQQRDIDYGRMASL